MSLNQYVPAFDIYLIFQNAKVKVKYMHEILFAFPNREITYKIWVDTFNIDYICHLSGVNFDPVVLAQDGEVQIDNQNYSIEYLSLVYNSRRHEYLVTFQIKSANFDFDNFCKKEVVEGGDKPLKNRFEVMDMSMENGSQ